MKNVMAEAWKIAREGAKKFGGKVVDYIAEALRMAWALVKKGAKIMEVTLKTLTGSRNHKTWVAEITGKCATYKFKRSFIDEYDNDGSNKFWKLLEGKVYDVCDGGHRYYAKVENGEIKEISAGQISEIFA